MTGRSIRIFLPDGTPAGLRTAELGLSTIKAVVAPRALLATLAERREAQRTGVYLVVGNDPEIPGRLKVYVGEADVVLDRIKAHNSDDSKDFFERVFVFVSKDDMLTKAHVRWLEARLLERLRLANRCTVANGSAPDGGGLPEADLAEMSEFLDQMQILLSALGLSVFEPAPAVTPSSTAPPPGEPPLFVYQGEGYRAEATVVSGAFVVRKGSVARSQMADSLADSIKALRAELTESKVLVDANDRLLLQQDYEFSSPSQAAQAFCGFSVNGRQAWRTAENMTFAQWQDGQLEAASDAAG